MSDDLLQEVQNELKQEAVRKLIAKYSRYLAVGLVLIVISGSVAAWWNQHKKNTIYNEAAEYMKTVQMLNSVTNKESIVAILDKFEQIAEGKTIYAILAKISIANIADALGNYNKSIYYYGVVADDGNVDITLRSYASLMKVASNLRSQKITVEEALQMIEDSASLSNGKIFSKSRNLLTASLLLEMGKKTEASKMLQDITSSAEKGDSGAGIAELLLGLTY